jgi:TPP-dependent indolepyruvate ferredoxin oxidoreductase alpha subunit
MKNTDELTVSSDAPGARLFLLGNEAIARGAIEAGVRCVASYPGTPSSEITETLVNASRDIGYYAEWSINEKVALEVAIAGSVGGLRSLAIMKHVGVNVAHDPLMTASYMGARGGLVLVSADDPGQWSSQNEQDNRYIARQAYVPVLEPASGRYSCCGRLPESGTLVAMLYSEKYTATSGWASSSRTPSNWCVCRLISERTGGYW